jgi:hypothetical protein
VLALTRRAKSLLAPPLRGPKGELIALARSRGVEPFNLAAEEFLRMEPWKQDPVRRDPWLYLCHCFDDMVDYAVDRKRREEENRRKQAADHHKQRWICYLRVAAVKDWPTMTDEQRAFRDRAKALVDKPARDVTDQELNQAAAIESKERSYWSNLLYAKRQEVHDVYKAVGKFVNETEFDNPEDKVNSTEWLRKFPEMIAKSESVTSLDRLAERLTQVKDMAYQERRLTDEERAAILKEGEW